MHAASGTTTQRKKAILFSSEDKGKLQERKGGGGCPLWSSVWGIGIVLVMFTLTLTFIILGSMKDGRHGTSVKLVHQGWTTGEKQQPVDQLSSQSVDEGVQSEKEKLSVAPPDDFLDLLKLRAINNQIVLTVATSSFLNLTLNWVCAMERIQLKNYIVGALDQTVYDALKSKNFSVFPAFKYSCLGGNELESAKKRDEDFHKVTFVKEETTLWALKQGYEVALSDTDVVWIHNPMADLQANYREYDFAFQSAANNDTQMSELNGGFMYIKPTTASLDALTKLMKVLSEDFTRFEQKEFRNLLCLETKRTSNNTCFDPESGAKVLILPRSTYGKAYLLGHVDDPKAMLKKADLYTLHQNGGPSASKQKRMITNEIWFLDAMNECNIATSSET